MKSVWILELLARWKLYMYLYGKKVTDFVQIIPLLAKIWIPYHILKFSHNLASPCLCLVLESFLELYAIELHPVVLRPYSRLFCLHSLISLLSETIFPPSLSSVPSRPLQFILAKLPLFILPYLLSPCDVKNLLGSPHPYPLNSSLKKELIKNSHKTWNRSSVFSQAEFEIYTERHLEVIRYC